MTTRITSKFSPVNALDALQLFDFKKLGKFRELKLEFRASRVADFKHFDGSVTQIFEGSTIGNLPPQVKYRVALPNRYEQDTLPEELIGEQPHHVEFKVYESDDDESPQYNNNAFPGIEKLAAGPLTKFVRAGYKHATLLEDIVNLTGPIDRKETVELLRISSYGGSFQSSVYKHDMLKENAKEKLLEMGLGERK